MSKVGLHLNQIFFLSYHVELMDVKIHVPVCTMTQEMYLRFNSVLKTKNAIYNLKKTSIVPHVISKGSRFYFNNDLFPPGEQPARFGLAFIRASAFQGSFE